MSGSRTQDVGGGVRAGTYVDEHRSAELFNQMLDLCGIERRLLLSLGHYDMARIHLPGRFQGCALPLQMWRAPLQPGR